MTTRELGRTGQQVSALGLGCMSMASDYAYGPSDAREATATLHRALELGITFWDTADVYGFGANEELLRPVLQAQRAEVFLATKFGFVADGQGGTVLDVRPERIAAACEASLRRLGVEVIDLYYAHRIDPAVPVEEMVVRWRIWCRPAKCGFWVCRRLRRLRCGGRRPRTRLRRCNRNTRCLRAKWRWKFCPFARSWA